MKKLLFLLALCLLLCGCNPRGRQSSDNFVPPDAEQLPSGVTPASRPPKTSESHAEMPAAVGVDRVKIDWEKEGEYDYSREIIYYSYRVPYLDFPTEYANRCSLEIERLFRNPAEESLEEMEAYRPPQVETVDFTADVCGEVLSVRVFRRDTDGAMMTKVYSIHAVTGEAVTPEQFLEAVGLEGDDPVKTLTDAVRARFEAKFAGRYTVTDVEYTTALTRTLEPLAQPEQLSMYLTENGFLKIAVEMFDPSGASGIEEITLP